MRSLGLARRWALACLLSPLVAAAAPVKLVDHRGVLLTLPAPPARIVSLMPSLTEGVCALGGCDRLVGTDRFSNEPPEVVRLPKLGGIEDAQVERIVALRPDVVIAAPSARVVDRLEQLGVPVFVMDSNSHADVHLGLQRIAALLGTPERAAPAWARIEQAMAAARSRVPATLRGKRVYFEVDGSTYAAGPGSFIGETLSRLGLGNVVDPKLGPFPKLNPEYVLRAQPDIIMATRENVDAMPGRPGWSSLRALQHRTTCAFAPGPYELLIRPGPRLGEAASLLADCLVRLGAAEQGP
ncbi:ABC transporter substrate-binding protein [Rhizobacter sp. LjRoot28]|uniref:ABC transporter substrate-binding protein n=1 Tax=Rhizobacter sp. LjRoot28 TaxID=3342309 RepID=UPI003ECF5BF0